MCWEYLNAQTGFTSMRRILLFTLLFGCGTAFAQKHEVGLTVGGLIPQDRGTISNALRLSGGTAWQANYAHRLLGERAELYGEFHFLANAQRLVTSANSASTRDIATIYLTPGVRVKFAPGSLVSPYVAVGAGAAFYQQSLLQIDGKPNPVPRNISRAAFDFGCGIDTHIWRWIGLRGEIRDFYTGSPAYNLSGLSNGQHNVVTGGGFVLKWGE
jgi:hypothetical protein